MEPRHNIGFRCPHHPLKPNPIFLGLKPKDLVGKYCKLAFVEDDRKEYMWVRVTGLAEAKGEELQGILDNDPVVLKNIQCGDAFEFSRKEIIEVL